MNAQTQDIQWYIAREGKQHGPLTDIEMRTFVAHSYLRPSDLIWRPGMADWQPATAVFPAVFQPPAPAPAPQLQPPPQAPQPAQSVAQTDIDQEEFDEPRPSGGALRRLAVAATILAVVGGGAYGVANYSENLARLLPGHKADSPPAITAAPPAATPANEPSKAAEASTPPTDSTAPAADAAQQTSPTTTPEGGETNAQTAAVAPAETAPAAPPSIDGSQIDARLQKISAWVLIKKEFPDWYVGHIAAAEKLAAEKKPEAEIATHLAQGLVTLRRQNAEKALAASPDKLKQVASAFLENLKALHTQSVSACFGFISKGETSPAVIEMLQTPEAATAFNNEINAIFVAVVEGGKKPVKHDPAVKTDFDLLIKELAKLGWKQEDLQTFSDPRLLSKRPPQQVCQMVQDWFVAHLAITDKAAQERLIYETLKPVVSG